MPDDPAAWVKEDDHGITVGWSGYAEYSVEVSGVPKARAILAGASEQDAALAFVLSVLPLALPLFGLEPLHGSAVGCEEGALLILGGAGTGKSTLAAALVEQGWRFLADDACAIDGNGILWPGPPLLSLRRKERKGLVVDSYNEKTVVVPSSHFGGATVVGGVVVLAPSRTPHLEFRRLSGQEAFRNLLRHCRAPRVLSRFRQEIRLSVISRLASLPIVIFCFDPARDEPHKAAEMLGRRREVWPVDRGERWQRAAADVVTMRTRRGQISEGSPLLGFEATDSATNDPI